jgi:ubiquinone/menaquinone biosynthesis C-methylase UbiE
MSEHYWSQFWIEHGENSVSSHPQAQVFRTLNKQPIDEQNWEETLAHIQDALALKSADRALDLCGGNGLIGSKLAEQCANVVIVDIAEGLLAHVDEGASNVQCIQGDMRAVEFEDQSFDAVLCYAALQYLTLEEAILLFERMYKWLTPGGRLFVGDIPDANKQWGFFNSPERQAAYFDNVKAGRPIVGTWFDRQWLTNLATHSGFSSVETLDQPDTQIYSWFRFDLRCTK